MPTRNIARATFLAIASTRSSVPYAEPSHTVLDFGCGNGGIMRIVDEHVDQIEDLGG